MAIDQDALPDSSPDDQEVAPTLRRLKRHFEISDERIGRDVEMSRSAVAARMAGTTDCRPRDLRKLARYFNVPVGVLFLGPDDALRWVLAHPEAGPEGHTLREVCAGLSQAA